MKKNKLLGLLALTISLIGFISGVNAQETETVNDWTSLWLCTTTHEANVCQLDNDIIVKGLIVSKPVTVDLNQHKIILDKDTKDVRIGIQTDGKVVFENGEIISEALDAQSIVTITAKNDANVNTELELKNVQMSIACEKGFGIVVDQQNGEGFKVSSSTITIDEKSSVTSANRVAIVNYASSTINVYGSVTSKNTGSAIEGSQAATGETNINIYDRAKVTSAKGAGILLMSAGTVIVNGGEVSGNSGIALTKGNLNVLGGTINGLGVLSTEHSEDAFGHINDNGAAVYIEPSDATKVDIKGGELTSKQSYAISAPGTNDQNKKLDIKIEKGTFESAKGGIEIKEDSPREAFIEAGATFLKDGEPDSSVLGYTNNLEISDSGVVGTLHNIKTNEVVNGTITVNKKAAEGETVVITVKPNSGYEVSKVKVTKGEEEITVTKNVDGTYSFEMPMEDVTVSAEFGVKQTPSKPAEDKNDIVVEEPKGDENVTLSTEASDVLKDSLVNTEDEELKALIKNHDVTIELETEKVTKDSLEKEELEKFEQVIEGANITEFFDLSIVVKADGLANHYLKELNKAITLSVALPELPEVAKGYARKYYILREHDGVVEKLDATISEDGKKLLFASDKFSKYAIAYVDEEIKDTVTDSNPSTIDSVFGYVTLAITSVGVLGVASKKIIKKMSF